MSNSCKKFCWLWCKSGREECNKTQMRTWRSRQLLGLACCVCLRSRCCCLDFLPPSSSSVRVCVCSQFVLIKSFCFVCNSCCYCCCCGETLTHSLSRLVSDTGVTIRRVRGTAAVVGVSCYLESGRRKREKEQDHHRFFGDPAFHQVCFTLFSSLTMDALFSFFLLPGSHKCWFLCAVGRFFSQVFLPCPFHGFFLSVVGFDVSARCGGLSSPKSLRVWFSSWSSWCVPFWRSSG